MVKVDLSTPEAFDDLLELLRDELDDEGLNKRLSDLSGVDVESLAKWNVWTLKSKGKSCKNSNKDKVFSKDNGRTTLKFLTI